MINITDKTVCSGCTACMAVCPAGCITMIRDEQGFLYPSVDTDRCIGCNACSETCERAGNNSMADEDNASRAYGAYAKDTDLRMTSSSGGVFTLLAEEIIRDGGAVVGAAFSDDYKSVNHVIADTFDDLKKFKGSKYLQSNLDDIFTKVKRMLDDGRKVLFSGTPCQTDGLRAFLGREYSELTLVDFICHGVPSPKIWAKYCADLEKKTGSSLSSANFRYKKPAEVKLDHNNGQVIFNNKTEDPYMRLFLSNYILRPSCYGCRHKGINRKSDITIADFWGVGQILPGFSDKKGTSLVLIHTNKGSEIFESISDKLIVAPTESDSAVNRNKSAIVSSSKPSDAENFWIEEENKDVSKLADSYCPLSNKQTVKSAIKKLKIYNKLKKDSKSSVEEGLLIVFGGHYN